MDEDETPQVELRGIRLDRKLKPRFTKQFGLSGTRWWAVVTLDIFDTYRRLEVSEWYFLIVCSPEFKEKPINKIPLNMGYTVVQPELDMEKVENEARQRFKNIKPRTWDEFHAQMEEQFLCED